MNRIILLVLILSIKLFSQGFDLFEEKKEKNLTLYKNLNKNRLHLSYSAYCNEHYGKYLALGYEYFITSKFAPFIEYAYELEDKQRTETKYQMVDDSTQVSYELPTFIGNDNFKDRSEINIGLTYRLTHRFRTWVFFATAGVSYNNSLHDVEKQNKGFGFNHGFIKGTVAYSFLNGVGLDYSFMLKAPVESSVWEPNNEIHQLSLTFEF